jgi:hypothetical protein
VGGSSSSHCQQPLPAASSHCQQPAATATTSSHCHYQQPHVRHCHTDISQKNVFFLSKSIFFKKQSINSIKAPKTHFYHPYIKIPFLNSFL